MLWNKFSYTLCSSWLVNCDAMTYWPTFNNDAMFGLGGQACCVVWVSIWDWRTSTRNRTRFLCRYWQYYEEEALVITLHLWFQLYVYCNNFIVPPSLPPFPSPAPLSRSLYCWVGLFDQILSCLMLTSRDLLVYLLFIAIP